MACNCGKSRVQAFVVELPDGKVMEVKSEAQARAEVTRAGGGRYRAKK